MDSTQSPKCCNLSVDTFEAPAKIQLLIYTLEANFVWAPPLAPQTQNIDDDLAGHESISLDEIYAAFVLLERKKEAMEREPVNGNGVLEGQSLAPKSVDDEIMRCSILKTFQAAEVAILPLLPVIPAQLPPNSSAPSTSGRTASRLKTVTATKDLK
ncbi:hypothetical protein EDB19DRAFT_1831154 [Suillus lakei]|nr:hypothetical protein EDB19DRAFT_1831154 [Suillus lakei]